MKSLHNDLDHWPNDILTEPEILKQNMIWSRSGLVLKQRLSALSRLNQLGSSKCLETSTSGLLSRNYASTSKTQNQKVALSEAAKAEPFLNGTNSIYMEDMYESWLEDRSSVHKV